MMKRADRWSLSTAAAAALVHAAIAAGQVTPTFNNVPFAAAPLDAGGTLTLELDVYLPTSGTGPFPVVLFVYGGGWQSGTFNNVPAFVLELRGLGFAVASARYRLSHEAIFPAQIHDVKAAVRHLRANAATFQLDPHRVGAWGPSAGGHLVSLLATSHGVTAAEGTIGGDTSWSSRIQALVDYYGPIDIIQMNPDVTTPPGSSVDHDAAGSAESQLIGFDGFGEGIGVLRANLSNPNPPFPQKAALAQLSNPAAHATPDDPPAFIVHGTSDTVVPSAQSGRLVAALTWAGVPNSLTPVAGAGHGGFPNSVHAAARAFLVEQLLEQPIRAGDLNCDGVADAADAGPMAQALLDRTGYEAAFPDCRWLNGDMTIDGIVDAADVQGFVYLVAGP